MLFYLNIIYITNKPVQARHQIIMQPKNTAAKEIKLNGSKKGEIIRDTQVEALTEEDILLAVLILPFIHM